MQNHNLLPSVVPEEAERFCTEAGKVVFLSMWKSYTPGVVDRVVKYNRLSGQARDYLGRKALSCTP